MFRYFSIQDNLNEIGNLVTYKYGNILNSADLLKDRQVLFTSQVLQAHLVNFLDQ